MIVARALCEEMEQVKGLLSQILTAVSPRGIGGAEDLVLQYPESTATLVLAPGETYTRETSVNRMLSYLSIDAPEGVIVTITRDNVPWLFASNEIGAMEFKKGVFFGALRIDVQNTTEITQNWSTRFIFT